jgi:hypothetical protein
MTDQQDAREQHRRKAKRFIFIGYFCLVTVVIAISISQVARQVYAEPAQVPAVRCSEELVRLMSAIDRATTKAQGSLGPAQDVLPQFRSDLSPEWDRLEPLRKACSNEPHAQALDAIEQLRYAEEHAVRRDSFELTDRRKQARLMLDQSLQADKR